MRRCQWLALWIAAFIPGVAQAQLPSTPDLGLAEGRCRAGEAGPAFLVSVVGLKDRLGSLRLEVYPPTDEDFLADDNVLAAQSKTFRRAEMPVPRSGPVTICIRVPRAANYTLSLLHDRDGNRKFGLSVDGLGFPNNPTLHFSKPSASAVRMTAGPGITPLTIRMNYRHGLLSFGPIGN